MVRIPVYYPQYAPTVKLRSGTDSNLVNKVTGYDVSLPT